MDNFWKISISQRKRDKSYLLHGYSESANQMRVLSALPLAGRPPRAAEAGAAGEQGWRVFA